MSLLELIVLAIGLSMDATAIAGTRGLAAKALHARDAALLALFFGGAQAIMPALGWVAGAALASRIAGWGDWVTAAVFAVIGGKMIYEAATSSTDEDGDTKADPFDLKVLAALAVATSIDALAAGVTLAVRSVNIMLGCAVIGVITAALSFAGAYAGRHFGSRLGKRLDIIGGLVLLGLAAKTLIEHHRGMH